MKKKQMTAMWRVLLLASAVQLCGCGNIVNAGSMSTDLTKSTNVSTKQTNDKVSEETYNYAEPAAESSSGENEFFTSRDLAQTADLSGAVTITVSDGETVSVTEAGVYILTGSAENAGVVIEAGDEDKVQLVLDGVSIVNTDQPCILAENADKVFLTSAEGSENVLTVSGEFGGDADAVIFSRDDLILNGLGTVTVNSSKDGVCTNDDLKLTGGSWNVGASDSAMKAHNGIYVYDGSYELKAGNDGLHAEDNDDNTVGCILIDGGSFSIQAGDDAVHAATGVTINGGNLDLAAAEGIEATQVIINDGTVQIKASDDGINAGRKSDSLNVKIEINGGTITVVMGSGDTDAVDSNGDLIITGGTIDITGQSPFDYDGQCSKTGGTIIINGTQTDTVTSQMMGGRGMMGGQEIMDGRHGDFGGKRS